MLCSDLNGKEKQGRGDVCIHIADSLCYNNMNIRKTGVIWEGLELVQSVTKCGLLEKGMANPSVFLP